ncbi:MAG: hypothetical protein ACI4RS_02245, partial [Monoglobaceae bacterium]
RPAYRGGNETKYAFGQQIQNNFFIAVGLGNHMGKGRLFDKIILNFAKLRDDVGIVPYRFVGAIHKLPVYQQ